MDREDLKPIIGGRGRISEVLARKRPLTLNMIRRISQTLRIPAEVLIQPYETEAGRRLNQQKDNPLP